MAFVVSGGVTGAQSKQKAAESTGGA